MIKAGILSMQRIVNYGSFLQAYGLKCILEDLGCDVQFVDYHPGETLIPANGGTGIQRKISKVMETLGYSAPLKEKIRFIKYKKNYAANYYPYLEISDQMNYNAELDVLVIGSDEVFNCVQSNTNVGFSPELFGEGNNAKKVITYAASFGNTTVEKLNKYKIADKVGEWLKKVDAISVRDINSGKVVETIAGTMPEYHLDPVLAYDFIGKCKEIPTNISEDKYMILYGYSGRFSKEECKEIRMFAKSRSLKVFCIGGVQDVCDRFIDCNPFQVIAYFQHAEYVVTDTFHGSIMSIITHRQFASVVRSTDYGNSEKLVDLLYRLNLYSRVVHNIKDIADFLLETVDYTETEDIVSKERCRTEIYLRKEIL